MLDHRTAAAAGAPPARRPRVTPCVALFLADGSHASRLRFAVGDRRRRGVALHERAGCACDGCGWGAHLAYVELLRLRVQTWTPGRAA